MSARRLVAMLTAVADDQAMICLPLSAQELRAFCPSNDLRVSMLRRQRLSVRPLHGFVTGIADVMRSTLQNDQRLPYCAVWAPKQFRCGPAPRPRSARS